MKQDKEYIFKKKSPIGEIIAVVVLSGLILALVINSWRQPLAFLLAGTPLCILVYFFYYEIKIKNQFNRYDRDKKIVISDDRLMLTYIRGNQVTIINSADVEKVEVYNQESLGKFGTYWYIVIYTHVGFQLLITKFTIPLLIYDKVLEKFLRKKPRFYFTKTFNYIDEQKFVP